MTIELALHQEHDATKLLQSLPGIVFSRNADDEHSVNFLSEGCVLLTEYTPHELSPQATSNLTFNDLIYPEDWVELQASIEFALTHSQPYSAEYRVLTKSGTQKWFLEQGVLCHTEPNRAGRIDGLIIDISAQKQAQVQLQCNAFYDSLTGLPNRSLFIDRLSHKVRCFQRSNHELFAVLFLDLDRFKVINDSLGHRAGDQLLFQVAQRLQGCVRPGDTVARLGGDEFTLLIDDVQDIQTVTTLCERILNEMRIPFAVEEQEIFTSISIGIALSSPEYIYAEDVIRDADIALYQAKALGKARFALFQTGMHIHAVARLQLENDLRRALQRQEFCLLYQPIITMESGTLAGFETFIYWHHPTRGLLAPGEFLPVAQDMGLMVALGQWVLRTACTQVSQWHQQCPLARSIFINVNLSSLEITHPDLIEFLQEVLTESQLNPLCLKLEITESLLMNNCEAVLSQLQRIKGLGIQLCLDDFGTGYSSLSYLDQFPIDVLKMDRSFIQRIDSTENWEIVRTILSLARTLGLTTVAEGVESTSQLAQLRALSCEFGQGYWFARPLDALQTFSFIQEQFSDEPLTSITVILPKLLIASQAGSYQLLLVGRSAWTLGRSQDCAIFLADPMVSREHAVILQLPHSNDFYFVDLGSRNGSFINHEPIKTPTLLQQGDLIRVGKSELIFSDTPSEKKLSAQPSKIVLIHQSSRLQGQVWREVLLTQDITIIWQTRNDVLLKTLRQIEQAGETLPDLLLLDSESLEPNFSHFLDWLNLRYSNLPIIFTVANSSTVGNGEVAQNSDRNLVPYFHLSGPDLGSNAMDVADKVSKVLSRLENHPPNYESVMAAAKTALQSIFRNETLF